MNADSSRRYFIFSLKELNQFLTKNNKKEKVGKKLDVLNFGQQMTN